MVITISTSNPYQPPSATIVEPDLKAPTAVSFHTDARLRRHALDQYLLHWHPNRLLFSSLTMIFVSGACLFGSVQYGATAFLPTMIIAMFASAAIYTALVYRTRKRIGVRLKRVGLDTNESMTLQVDVDRCTLTHSGESHDWPNEQLRLHRTRRGLLICPEPLLYMFVARKSDFQAGSYKQFVKMIRARVKK